MKKNANNDIIEMETYVAIIIFNDFNEIFLISNTKDEHFFPKDFSVENEIHQDTAWRILQDKIETKNDYVEIFDGIMFENLNEDGLLMRYYVAYVNGVTSILKDNITKWWNIGAALNSRGMTNKEKNLLKKTHEMFINIMMQRRKQ
jgi:hypothetical protein